ncbi:MAG: acetyl-CoA carboxylase carboxyltransferase subunit alpha, partial [Bacteroidia bacterium]|nr:acetyl-CoA carboxylase carboxyltransferase subunit alpha [Bacteroidia bacterium]
MVFLDFEKPIEDLFEKLDKAKEIAKDGTDSAKKVVSELEKQIKDERKEVYKKLTPWQRVQVSRHPKRPYSLAYIESITKNDFIELHGDRNVKDDNAMVGGIGSIEGQSVMFVGQQKGVNTKMRQFRNFGMPNPEGYRKALRLMKLAEKFNIPVVTLIDTPGAYPGLEAEERGQGEAIARNIYEMVQLKVPIICIVVGEGASGGALGIGVGDRMLMLENTWYSVISPESCSSILWRSWDFKEKAADALKLTANDMLENKLIDGIIQEPAGGAHTNPEKMFQILKTEITKHLDELVEKDVEIRINNRIEKFGNMGVFVEE